MSFQLIHTSAPHLLDSAASGYGTVARSAQLPAALYAPLAAISNLKEAQGLPSETRQFGYHILNAQGESWHILSCVQQAGADYSCRACHTAHHLIFSQSEVAEMLRHEKRPTPAGLTLALLHEGFWVRKWEGPPALIQSEPPWANCKMLDASVQPTWKRHTAHKANARAFYTAPYHQECLVMVPSPMKEEEILALLHESDWLSHTRGWGNTYTTHADEKDNFSETRRIIARPQQTILAQRARRSGRQVLTISPELEIPIEPPPSNAQIPATLQNASGATQVSIVRSLNHAKASYHYTEEPDWMRYDIPLPRSPYQFTAMAGASGLIACCAMAFWVLRANDTAPPPDAHSAFSSGLLETSPEENALNQLTRILIAPYDRQAIYSRLHELSLTKNEGAEESWIAECARLINQAGKAEGRHAGNLKRLCECARLLGIQENELARLYIREAAYHLSAEDWQKQLQSERVEDWLKLHLAEPTLVSLFQSPELQNYLPKTGQQQPEETPTILATAQNTPAETQPDDEEEPQAPGRLSLIPSPAVCGDSLPPVLAAALTKLPLTITTGKYIVSLLKKGDALQPSQQLELSEEGYRLHITPTENDGEYRIFASHKRGMPVSVPGIVVRVRGEKLRSVYCEDDAALAAFPVPTKENFYTNVILAPEFGIPLPFDENYKLPEVTELQLNLQSADIEVDKEGERVRLRLSEKLSRRGFPWNNEKRKIQRLRFALNLPGLNAPNGLAIHVSTPSPYNSQPPSVSHETENMTTLICQFERKPALPKHLQNTFDRIANTPCCGQASSKGGPALAELYYIAASLSDKKMKAQKRRQLHQAYFKLLSHSRFNEEIQKLMPNLKQILLSPKEAGSSGFRYKRMRNIVAEELDKPDIQSAIQNLICQKLSQAVETAYKQEKQLFETDKAKKDMLMLQHISHGEHGELLWHFNLKTTP